MIFSPSELVHGVEAGKEEERKGKGEEGEEGGSGVHLEDQGCS